MVIVTRCGQILIAVGRAHDEFLKNTNTTVEQRDLDSFRNVVQIINWSIRYHWKDVAVNKSYTFLVYTDSCCIFRIESILLISFMLV